MPKYLIYRYHPGGQMGGVPRDYYLVGTKYTDEELIDCYKSNRARFESGEWFALTTKEVTFENSVKIKELN